MADESVILLEFVDQSKNFANGFEAGRVWELIKSGETVVNLACSTGNKELLRTMCELFHADYKIDEIDDIWINLNIYNTRVGGPW